jgi:hypothetical protein
MLRDTPWYAMVDSTAWSSIPRLARYLSSETSSLVSLHRGRDSEVCKFYRHLMHNASVSNLNHQCLTKYLYLSLICCILL